MHGWHEARTIIWVKLLWFLMVLRKRWQEEVHGTKMFDLILNRKSWKSRWCGHNEVPYRKEKKVFEYVKDITEVQGKQHNTEQNKGGHVVRHKQDDVLRVSTERKLKTNQGKQRNKTVTYSTQSIRSPVNLKGLRDLRTFLLTVWLRKPSIVHLERR